jgi:hypothetical protein
MGCWAVGLQENTEKEDGMKIRLLSTLTTVALLMASATGAHATSLLLNGDFETGDSTAWILAGNVNVVSDVAFRTNAGAVGSFPIGTYAVDLGGGDRLATGVLTQDFDTTPSHEYDLSFDYGRFQFGGGGPQSIRIELINPADDQRLLDTVVTDSSADSDLALLFDDYFFQFTAAGVMTRLSFSDVSAGTTSTDGVLDNVAVTAVPILAPEPATVLLFAAGFTGLLSSRIIHIRHRR